MKRNHIHLAQGISTTNAISGLRASAQILIFIDVPKALEAGIKFALSDNGVVLTEGDQESGFLKPEFFLRVEDMKRNALPGWEGPGPIESKAVAMEEPTQGTSSRPKRGKKPKEVRDAPVEGLENLTVSNNGDSNTTPDCT